MSIYIKFNYNKRFNNSTFPLLNHSILTLYLYSFEKLEVWQDARNLVKKVYTLTKNYPNEERFIICLQMQRAAISVVSNIAEGVTRTSAKEQVRFTEVAYSSLMEVYCHILVSLDLNYITSEKMELMKSEINKIANKLTALRKSQLIRV